MKTRFGSERRMFSPVRCLHCGAIYDMGAVQTVGRWTDCSGCKLRVDDRSLGGGIGPVGRRDVERVAHPHPTVEQYTRMNHYGDVYVDHVIWPPASGHYPI